MISRRHFLGTTTAAFAAPAMSARTTPNWGGPVVDIHLHFSGGQNANLEHMQGCGVSNAVLLTSVIDEENVKAAIGQNPKRFARFAEADITKPEGIDLLRKSVQGGAIGLGEIKFHVAVDGPEMRRLYDMAAEMKVPVLIHFQEVPQFEGEGVYTTPFRGLPAVLKAHPKTTFIGHADAFWANISADVPGTVAYPAGAVKAGGLTDRMLADYPNLYGDMSANSGRNAITRDPEFTKGFLARHQSKLMFGSDCSCRDGRGTGQESKQPALQGKCVARETLSALKQLASPEVFRKVTWTNATKLLRVSFR